MVKIKLLSGGTEHALEMEDRDGSVHVRVSGEPVECDVTAGPHGGVSILLDGRSYEARVEVDGREVRVEIDGERFCFEKGDGRGSGGKAIAHATAGRSEVKAPMPGKIVKLLVAEGDSVGPGQGLLLFEAMKMQNEIRSPHGGRVEKVAVREGQAVESKDLLVIVQA